MNSVALLNALQEVLQLAFVDLELRNEIVSLKQVVSHHEECSICTNKRALPDEHAFSTAGVTALKPRKSDLAPL